MLYEVITVRQPDVEDDQRGGFAREQREDFSSRGEVAASFQIGFAPPGWENLATALGADTATRRLLLELGLTRNNFV